MQLLNPLLLFLLLTLLASCGDAGINGRKRILLTNEGISSLMAYQNFECAPLNGGSCPSGMARLFIHNPSDEDNSATCTGFLNGPDRLVTNNHCVSTIQECSNTYISVYNGSQYQAARCKRIIKTQVDPGALSAKGIDYTVMELDRTIEIQDLSLATSTPQLGEMLTAWVIDHKSINEARITELNCLYHKQGNSMQLSDCPVIQGNSGSPLLNVYGEVVGTIWGSTTSDEVNADMPLHERRSLNEYAFATQLNHFQRYLYLKY